MILGSSTDAHAVHIKTALEQWNVRVEYWDSQKFPTQLQLSWLPHDQTGKIVLENGRVYGFEEIHSVFWRCLSGIRVPLLKDSKQYEIAFNDASSTLRSLIQACPAHWVNSWQAYQAHKEKPLQLSQAKAIGIPIPATLISNNPQQILEFSHCYSSIIFKPVYGGAYAQRVTPEHLEINRLRSILRISPVTIQEYIPGTNIRSYLVGDSVYTAEIRSDALDFRTDKSAELIPIETPLLVQQWCWAIAKAFFLEWTAIDWRRTPTGDYFFLEANPSPMFLHFEHQTGFPITQKLIDLLIS